MKNILKKIKNKIDAKLFNFYDSRLDKKICSVSLVKYVESVYRDDKNKVGMTGSQSTRYVVLDKIFSNISLTSEDNFIDIGCGKGRVLAYLQKINAPCKINGIEINEEPGKMAKEWSSKYPNIKVQIGDAFKIDYNEYTVCFIGRPFLPKTFYTFIDYFEANLSHPVKFIYFVDQESGAYLKNRTGWHLEKRETVEKIHGMCPYPVPQTYSIWTFNPNEK